MRFVAIILISLIQAQDVIAEEFMGLKVKPEHTGSPFYARNLYNTWIDADGDKEDTRVEVLIEESLITPQIVENSSGKRKVSSGLWVGHYTGFVTSNPEQIDIDHLVPLKEVHLSGGYAWSAEKKEQYANDLDDSRTLIAVYDRANQSKGDSDPASWMPPNRSFWCQYLNDWIAVKKRWELSIDQAEKEALETGLSVCDRYEIRDAISGRH